MNEQRTIFSIFEITQAVKQVLEEALVPCWVEGEISNWKAYPSGHCYFTLKDEKSQLNAVLWRSQRGRLKFEPENGQKVLAHGSVRVYEPRGVYQLSVDNMEPAGLGALQLAFEQLRDRLAKEGLFDPERKKDIPTAPAVIGVVTSPKGAALRDILQIIQRRAPGTEVILRPAHVQGKGAAEEVARGIEELNEHGRAEVIIVGRGGGSIEDLWAFNEETVARAIAASGIPIISAVGHEVDFTISDFVADLRAPTPSAAAELAVQNRATLVTDLQSLRERIHFAFQSFFRNCRDRFEGATRALLRASPIDRIDQLAQRTDELARRMQLLVLHRIQALQGNLGEQCGKLEGLSPLATLSRGYSITRLAASGKIVKSVGQIRQGENLLTRLTDGEINSRAE